MGSLGWGGMVELTVVDRALLWVRLLALDGHLLIGCILDNSKGLVA